MLHWTYATKPQAPNCMTIFHWCVKNILHRTPSCRGGGGGREISAIRFSNIAVITLLSLEEPWNTFQASMNPCTIIIFVSYVGLYIYINTLLKPKIRNETFSFPPPPSVLPLWVAPAAADVQASSTPVLLCSPCDGFLQAATPAERQACTKESPSMKGPGSSSLMCAPSPLLLLTLPLLTPLLILSYPPHWYTSAQSPPCLRY